MRVPAYPIYTISLIRSPTFAPICIIYATNVGWGYGLMFRKFLFCMEFVGKMRVERGYMGVR